jgi:hypothetical protein
MKTRVVGLKWMRDAHHNDDNVIDASQSPKS